MASIVYNTYKRDVLLGLRDWSTDVLRILLLKQANTIDPDHEFVSDVVDGVNNVEADATNYARQTLTTPTVTADLTNDRAEADADDVTFTGLGNGTNNTIVAAVIYSQVGGDDTTPGNDPAICLVDHADTTTNGGDFTIQWNAEGIIQLT